MAHKNSIDKLQEIQLIEAAIKVRENAYAPYSGYLVGAAVLSATGKVFTGCNVENASYGATICAERTAILKMVSEGEKCIKAIAIVGGKAHENALDYAYPCGACRQVISEFASEDCMVLVAKSVEDYQQLCFADLLPQGFEFI